MAHICDQNLIVEIQISLIEQFLNLLLKAINAGLLPRRHTQNGLSSGQLCQLFFRNLCLKIRLIQQNNRLSVADQLDDHPVILIERTRTVDHIDNQICLICSRTRSAHTDLLNAILGLTDSRRINDIEADSSEANLLLERVSRRSRNVRDNRTLLTHQNIHQRRFSCIRLSENDRLDSL